MNNSTINTEQGHWILAKMGKRVLRPGGKELTEKLIQGLRISSDDSIVEFAPGLGYTASVLLSKHPKKYIGVEINEEAALNLTHKLNGMSQIAVLNCSAAHTGLSDACSDKVVGEAMLTMQADHRKSEIIREAFRILKNGGQYGIHELGLKPDDIGDDIKHTIQQSLAQTIKVNARPLTKQEWCTLLIKEGFAISEIYESPMHLLRASRVISDEGIFRTLKIGFNILTHHRARKRIVAMRKVFEKYESQMVAYAIIARKP
ncbi:MAG TPA: methyltransferase domain-containing protein [Saprospiraceae bacterium]|nr:methyltransferase domain-containing protein [Saprospiraceae bacterium]